MLEKRCKHCATRSFSADTLSPWICPGCGVDITREPAQTPDQPWEPTAEDYQAVDREIAEFEEGLRKE